MTSEPPTKFVKQSNKNLQTGHGNTGTEGTHNSNKDLKNKIPESSCGNTGTQGKNVSRTFTNSALAKKKDLSAKESEQNI